MSILTSRHLTELADCFLAFAQAVGNYRFENSLSRAANRKLSDLQWTLLNYSDDLYTTSAILSMNDVSRSLNTIKTITDDINENYEQLRRIQKAINVAAAGATLGAAIFSRSPQAIGAAIRSLRTTWQEDLE